MLRFLTHKLRTQSLNEEPNIEKAQEDHDSGTESDDESGNTNGFAGEHNTMEHEEECEWGGSRVSVVQFPIPRSSSCDEPGSDMMMLFGGRDSASSQFESCYIDSALPSDSDHAYDHHSSEEELEVINSSYQDLQNGDRDGLLGDDEVRGPGTENKRKWSQVASNRLSVESTSSSDDEVQGLLRPLSTPVEFCTSPPVNAHKPSRSQSPPPKLFLFSSNTNGAEEPTGAGPRGGPVALNGSSGGVFRGLRPCDQNVGEHQNYQHNHNQQQQQNPPVGPLALANSQNLQNGFVETGAQQYQRDGRFLEERQEGRSHDLSSSPSGGVGLSTGRSSRSGRESTSRKRHRHHNHNPRHIQRPWLDFEKMQQLKARSVTTWRSGGELSLYCS